MFNEEGSHGTVVELCRQKALSTSDRILEMLNRVMVTVLKTSGSPADAVVPRAKRGLSVVQERFKVQLKTRN